MLTRRKLTHDWLARAATLALALCLALAGCTSPTDTPTPNDFPTQPPGVATATPEATATSQPTEDTNTPAALPTDGPTAILGLPVASDTPAISVATRTPSPTPGGACTNNVRFVSDVSVPDGTQFLPGQPVDKQWRVRNIGTCDWGADYRLVLVSGNAMGAASAVALYPAKAGSEAILEVNMTAPADPGAYTGRWQARSPTAKLFGDRVFVTINVVAITATVTITPTP